VAEQHTDKGTLLSGVSGLYTKSLAEHGLTSKGVGWKDEASQRLRFQKLAQVIDPTTCPAGMSANDLGCGYGAMFTFLDTLGAPRLEKYYGYDISDEMLAAARGFIPDARAELIKAATVTHDADYSFVSGTFNVKLEASDREWEEYVKEMLAELARKSKAGFAFNLLSTYVDWKQDNLYYADPLTYFDFCKRHFSRYVSLLHDYPLYEWTRLVRIEGREYK
jgi:SAM-dependent methyltransferase